jgi:hypothetical protein
MSKRFTYTKITGHYYCQHSEDWEQDGIEFDYEVEDRKLIPEIVDLVFEEYFCDNSNEKFIKDGLKRIIEENELVENLAERYEETLKEIFKDEAMEFYND